MFAQKPDQKHLESLLDALPEGIAVLDPDGTIIFCSNNFADLVGFKRENLENQPFGRPWHGRSADEIAAEAERPSGATEYVTTPSGGQRALAFLFRKRTDGPGTFAFVRKCSEVKSRDQDSREERRYRQILDSVRVIPWEFDLDSQRFTYVGLQAPSILGYSVDSWLQPDFLKQTVLSADQARFFSTLRDCARMREERTIDFTIHDLYGAPRIMRGDTVPSDDGGDGMLRGFFLDVTEMCEAEEEKRRMEQRLHSSQKLESLGLLAGGIAHDFNNYLMAIIGNAELAMMHVEEGQDAHKFVSKIEKAATHASELTRELLVYSGRRKPEFQLVNLSEIVREMPDLLQPILSKRAVIQYQIGTHVPPIEADPAQIHQAVMNLIINASDALGEEQGIITVRSGVSMLRQTPTEDAFLTENLRPGKYVYFEVSDTGNGMDAQTRKKVFDPFFTTKPKGRGLGLASVLGIVRAHAGGVTLESRPGEGTTFRILFPPAGRLAHAQHTTPIPLREKREIRGQILVVDDEISIAEIASSILRRAGYKVLIERNGKEAVETFRAHQSQFSAVVMDVSMPEMDGVDALPLLREINSRIPVLLISGHQDLASSPAQNQHPLTSFLQKPFNAAQLQDEVEALIEKSSRKG